MDEPLRRRVRLVQQRRDQAGAGLPAPVRGPGPLARRMAAQPARPAGPAPPAAAAASSSSIFSNPLLPNIKDYYEPWTYDYENLISAPLGDDFPVAEPRSLLTGRPTKIEWSANWDDDLGGAPEHGHLDPVVEQLRRDAVDKVRFEYEQAFMFFLPRICEHCLNPSCVASCPSGRDVQAQRGRHRAGGPGPLPRLADVRDRLPVQEGVLQPPDRQGREVHVLLPARRGRSADRVQRDLRGSAALHRSGALRRRPGHRGGLDRGPAGPVRGPARPDARPERPRGRRRGPARGDQRRLGRGGPALTGLRAGEDVPGRAAAAPGVPHHAHGLVRAAAVPGGGRAARHRARRGGRRQPVRGDRHAAHPGRVPRRPVHRRRHGPGHRRCCSGWRRCARTCAG